MGRALLGGAVSAGGAAYRNGSPRCLRIIHARLRRHDLRQDLILGLALIQILPLPPPPLSLIQPGRLFRGQLALAHQPPPVVLQLRLLRAASR